VLLAESFGQDIVWLTRERHQDRRAAVPATTTVTTQLARSAGG